MKWFFVVIPTRSVTRLVTLCLMSFIKRQKFSVEYKPVAMQLLQEFSKFYDKLRQKDTRFLPDGKTQITGTYDDNIHILAIKDWTINYQNTEEERGETDQLLMDKARELAATYNLQVENS